MPPAVDNIQPLRVAGSRTARYKYTTMSTIGYFLHRLKTIQAIVKVFNLTACGRPASPRKLAFVKKAGIKIQILKCLYCGT